MKKNHSEIAVVLDRSGSMGMVTEDTIGGFNTFLEGQKNTKGTANFTLAQFDNHYQIDYDGVDINEVEPLNHQTYQPRGSTALYDAIARTITSIGKRLDAMDEADKPETVIMVIQTDGYENASHEFNSKDVNAMITHQQTEYNWQFVFIGADQDAISSAKEMGIGASHAMTYAKNSQGSDAVYASITSNISQVRCHTKTDMSFTSSDRSAQKEAGA